MNQNAEAPASAVRHIEENLAGRLGLSDVAASTNYSKHYLHRRFSRDVGMTMGDYISRRRLTEAAKMLVFTDWPILDIAVSVGFGTQQSFSAAFKRMFKKTPGQYRAAEEFWPLQSRLRLEGAALRGADLSVRLAHPSDRSDWMALLDQVVDGYPHLDETEYLTHLDRAMARREALVCEADGRIVGALAFSREEGTIDFLGVLPPVRGRGVSKALLAAALGELSSRVEVVSTTTFREGDAADTGWRAELLSLGFAEAELLVEFGYPTQRLVVPKDALREACDAE